MGASSTTTDDTSLVIKAAKKELKRSDSNSLKIKQLTKSLLSKFESNSISKDSIKSILVSDKHNDVFVVDGKIITLKKKSSKKRKSMDSSEDTNTNTNTPTDIVIDKKAAKKAAKKAKKDKKKSSSTTTTTTTNTDNTSIQQWRTQNKIVLKDANKNEKVTKSLDSNTAYYPYQTFDIDSINKALLEQCTNVNGFKVPSPIQAQCWVSSCVFLLSQISYARIINTHSHITNTHYMLNIYLYTHTHTHSPFY